MPDPLAPLQDVDDLLDRVLSAPESSWQQALDEVCARHPESSARLRRRFEYLRRAGLTDSAPSDAPPAPGQRFGPYRLLDWIGAGGMGVVFRARHDEHDRDVALKLMRPELLQLDSTRERFVRECRAMAQVEHPAICTVYDYGECEGTPFLAMRRVAGDTLGARLDRARKSRRLADLVGPSIADGAAVGVALQWFEQLARGLHEAHGQGLVHRDVKPDNVVVDDAGRPVLLDFGLARADGVDDLTRTGEPIGTPAYMAPEQVRGAPTDPRTDVYALGAALYECLTLRPPHEAATRDALYRQILEDDVDDPRRANSRVPRDVAVVIAKALEKDPRRRYATAAALADDLERARRGDPVRARPVPVARRVTSWVRRRPLRAAAAAVLAVALVALVMLQREAASRARAQNALLASRAAVLSERDAHQGALLARAAWEQAPDLQETRSRMLQALARDLLVEAVPVPGLLEEWAAAPGDAERVAAVTTQATWLRVGGSVPRQVDDWRGRTLAWFPDGSRFVVADTGPGLRLFDRDGAPRGKIEEFPGVATTGQILRPLQVMDSAVDGRLLVGGNDGWIYELAFDGACHRLHRAHDGAVLSMRAVPSHRGIVTVGGDARATLWQLPEWTPRTLLAGSDAPITGAVVDEPNGLLLTGHADGAVRLVPLSGNGPPLLFRDLEGPVEVVALSPDAGELFAADLEQNWILHDLGSGQGAVVARHKHSSNVRVAAWQPDGAFVAFGDHRGFVSCVDRRGRLRRRFAAHSDAVTMLRFEGRDRFRTGSWDGEVRVWNTTPSAVPEVWAHEHAVFRLAWLPDGEHIVSSGGDGRLCISELRSGRVRATQTGQGRRGWGLAVAPDGRRVWTQSPTRERPLRSWDLARPGLVLAGEGDRLPAERTGVRWLATSAAGLLGVGCCSGRAFLMDPADDATPIELAVPGRPAKPHRMDVATLAFSRDSRLVGTASLDGSAHVWTSHGNYIATLVDGSVPVWSLDFAPHEPAVVLAFADGRVELHPVSGGPPRRFEGPSGRVSSARVSPDGRFVAACSSDGNVYVWTWDGTLWLELPHDDLLHCLEFSPDGEYIAVGGASGAIRVWPVTARAIAAAARAPQR